jgi:hypothetical protein
MMILLLTKSVMTERGTITMNKIIAVIIILLFAASIAIAGQVYLDPLAKELSSLPNKGKFSNLVVGAPLSSTLDSWCYQVTFDSGTVTTADDVVVGSMCFQLSSTDPLVGEWTFRRIVNGSMVERGSNAIRSAIVVAANNSLAEDKAQADFVCDGVNDQIEIQAAIDLRANFKTMSGPWTNESGDIYSMSRTAEPYGLVVDNDGWQEVDGQADLASDHQWAWESNTLYVRDATGDPDTSGVVIRVSDTAATGARILMLPGDYYINDTVYVHGGMWLMGSGMSQSQNDNNTTWRLADTYASSNGVIRFRNLTHEVKSFFITISDFNIEGNSNNVSDVDYAIFMPAQSSDITIENFFINDIDGTGIWVDGSSWNLFLKNVWIEGVGGTGSGATGSTHQGIYAVNLRQVYANNVYIFDCGYHGIYMKNGCHHWNMNNILIRETYRSGIAMVESSNTAPYMTNWSNVLIQDPVMRNNPAHHGIEIMGCQDQAGVPYGDYHNFTNLIVDSLLESNAYGYDFYLMDNNDGANDDYPPDYINCENCLLTNEGAGVDAGNLNGSIE